MILLRKEPPRSFLREETRNNFYVTEKIKKIWAVEIDLLEEFERVCTKYNLKYIVFAGTLLGVVRHQGFIPWDDDLDVAMPRDDFEKLVKIPESEFEYPYFLQSALSDKAKVCLFARLRNSDTTGMLSWTKTQMYNNGIYIDIHPMDACPPKKIMQKIYYLKKKRYTLMMNCYYADENLIKSLHGWRKPTYRILKRILNKTITYEKLYKRFVDAMTTYQGKTHHLFMSTGNALDEALAYSCDEYDFNEIDIVPFEYITVRIPRNYDSILTSCYGDYMQLPSDEEKKEWHSEMITFDPDTPYKDYMTRNGIV